MQSNGRSGFVLITMLFSVVVLIAFLGLAVDTGYMELVKTRMQTAADAAALAGAQEIKWNGGANVVAGARADAAINGFTHGQNGVSVTVNNPPALGYSMADSTGVEVLISRQVNTLFLGVLGTAPVTVNARAVARQGPGTSCVHVLDPTSNAAFSSSGGANVQINCGVVVDSSGASAFSLTGGTKVSATSFSVWGGKSIGNSSTVTPMPVTGIRGQGDPLAYIPAPAVGGCDYTNKVVNYSSPTTLAPGVYCNGISISNGADVTFAPGGTYILKGGGLDIGGGVSVRGTGITIYNTAGGGYSFHPFNFHASANVTISAPTTGPLAGILLFQDRSIVSTLVNSFNGGSDSVLNGSLYFPGGAISYSGGSDAAGNYSIIVARTVTFSGGTKMHNDYSSLPNGSPVRGMAVISE